MLLERCSGMEEAGSGENKGSEWQVVERGVELVCGGGRWQEMSGWWNKT